MYITIGIIAAIFALAIGVKLRSQKKKRDADYQNGLKATEVRVLAQDGMKPFTGTHPLENEETSFFKDSLAKIQANIQSYKADTSVAKEGVSIMICDSLGTFAADKVTFCDHRLIIGLPGRVVNNYKQYTLKVLDDLKAMKPSVIVTGCNGNAMFHRQDVDWVIKDSIDWNNWLRTQFPDARIVNYGWPPTDDPYVIQNQSKFESAISDWSRKDKNASAALLNDGFGEFGGLVAIERDSADTVHLSQEGKVKFDNRIWKAIRAIPGTIIQ